MSKADSQLMKGVAILLMIYLHLFDSSANLDLCSIFLFIDHTPIVYILTKATHPISFFLIIGGYGLFKVNEHGDNHRFFRIFRLYLHWWLIMGIFVVIGHCIMPSNYPNSISYFLLNALGFYWTYNKVSWFLLPYCILSVFSPYIFRIMSRFRASYNIVFTLIVFILTSFSISRFGPSYFFHHPILYNVILPFHLLFSFTLGAMAAREKWFEKIRTKTQNIKHINFIAGISVLILIFINCIFKYNYFYAFLIISSLSLIKFPSVLRYSLQKLGDNSMNMWLIHGWFCYYFFRDYLFALKYPVIIFIVLVALSYIFSLVVNKILSPFEKLLFTKKEFKSKPIL